MSISAISKSPERQLQDIDSVEKKNPDLKETDAFQKRCLIDVEQAPGQTNLSKNTFVFN